MPSLSTCTSLIYSQYFYPARGGIPLAPRSGAASVTSSYAPASRRPHPGSRRAPGRPRFSLGAVRGGTFIYLFI